MNIKHYPRHLTLGLVALGEVCVAQSSPRSAALAQADPSGVVMTVTAVSVVFGALLLLYLIFSLIGKLMQRVNFSLVGHEAHAPKPKKTEYPAPTSAGKPSGEALVAISLALDAERRACTDEVALAISMALVAYTEDQHDHESYVLTFGHRRATHWNARSLGMRPTVAR